MPRYFLELAYKGTDFSGFQVQLTARTIQSEVERAFSIYFRRAVELTGSSRTDAGVHARQNYFHFDWEQQFDPRCLYHLNAILDKAIVLKQVAEVPADAHCRFHALQRQYRYSISRLKDPFTQETAWHFPYQVQADLLVEMADMVCQNRNFIAFSKRNTQVKTFECEIFHSRWLIEPTELQYEVVGNRFLRGMVRGLVSSMLKAARGSSTIDHFRQLLEGGKQASADFAAPAHGLCLERVLFPPDLLPA